MRIRQATLDDAAAIAENNIHLAAESENKKLSKETTLQGVKAVLSDSQKGFYVVAEHHNHVVGQLFITYEWSDWRNMVIWWLQSIYVAKNWRRQGVFTALFSWVKNTAQEQGVTTFRLYVHTSNTQAIQAYQRLGMNEQDYRMFQTSLPREYS